ncbi:MAG: hypothetical protein ACON4E_07580 [Flavobacteriales bacterium]
MIKHFLKFKVWLFFLLLASFALHYFFLKDQFNQEFSNLFQRSYLGNFIITSIVYFVLLFLKEKQSKNLGFVFLFTSFLKFIFFYGALYPSFNQDGVISRTEFFVFFIPYAVSLIFEVRSLVVVLNDSNHEKNN